MADINDILGINLPKEEPGGKRKIIENLIQDLVFSIGQGYSAGGRGPQGRSAGIGAALQGPMVRQQMMQKQAEDAQAKQIEMAKFRELMRQGRNREAMELLQISQLHPEETPQTGMTLPPAPTEPVVEGTPETGLTVKSMGEPTYQYQEPSPVMFTLPNGQQIPIPRKSAGQMRQDALLAAKQKANLDIEAKMNEPYSLGVDQKRMVGGREIARGISRPLPQPQLIPGRDIPLSPEVAKQRMDMAAAGRVPPQPPVPSTQFIDDPKNPGHQILVTVDKNGATATPVTLNGSQATKRTANEQNRASQAVIVSDYADHIIGMINKNPEAVGPILGRIAKGETRVGTVSPQAKAIGTALGSFIALQPILHGFRGGSQTVEHFNGVLGDQSLNAEALKASLMEIKNLAKDIKDGGDEKPALSLDDALDKAFGKKKPK